MFFRTKPTFREALLGTIALISLSGLLALSYVDNNSRQVFLQMAAFIIGAVVGHIVPVQK